MNGALGAALLSSVCCAAVGQVLLKLGAQGRLDALALINRDIAGGLALYAVSLVLWLYALVRLPLSTVYPFTALTLILVGALSSVVLGERPTPFALAGWCLVALGLGVMWLGARAA